MAKPQVTIKKNKQSIETTLRAAVKTKGLLSDIAVFIRERIYQNTKRGYYGGVRKNLAKFKPLSFLYIEYRKSLVAGAKDKTKGAVKKASKIGLGGAAKSAQKAYVKAQFGDFFSPARSNLTMTGQMLDALKDSVDTSAGTVTIYIDDTSRKDDDLTNAEVAKKVAEEGRPFLGLDAVGRDRVRRMVISDLRRRLKRR